MAANENIDVSAMADAIVVYLLELFLLDDGLGRAFYENGISAHTATALQTELMLRQQSLLLDLSGPMAAIALTTAKIRIDTIKKNKS